jgi:hypothetical protein
LARWNLTRRKSSKKARKEYAQQAEDFIAKCYDLHEAFALSLKPEKTSDALKQRLMAMVRQRQA